MTFHTPNMMKLKRKTGWGKPQPNKRKVVLPKDGKVTNPFETIEIETNGEKVKTGIPKPLKIGLYVLLGIGIIFGLFFLFCWGTIDFVGNVGKGVGF